MRGKATIPGRVSKFPQFRFGVFELDPQKGELRKSGIYIRLQKQPLRILALLASKPEEVVSREVIRREIWGDETFVDFEHGMNACIRQIRTALGDDATSPRYIETIPRQGYRFIAPIQTMDASRDPYDVLKFESGTRLQKYLRLIFLAALAAGAVAVIGTFVWQGAGFRTSSTDSPIRIAVLPFRTSGTDTDQEYFADGMTDAIIANLAKVRDLRVISRTSTMQYKGTNQSLRQIALDLNVDMVVGGSVLRADDKVRITAQLIEATTDHYLWVETYERDMRDILEVQSEVAQAVVEEIQLELSPEESTRLASSQKISPEVYEAYLKGRYFWSKRTATELKTSVEYFEKAIHLDPGYAVAYAGLADSYIVLGDYSKAEVAALEALEIDPTLAEAHASLGRILTAKNWDWAAAENAFRRAGDLNPSYATSHQWYSHYLSAVGRHEEAVREARKAQELDPLSLIAHENVGWTLYLARRFDEAIAQLRSTLEMDRTFVPALESIGLALTQVGQDEDAISSLQEAASLTNNGEIPTALLAYAYAMAKKEKSAKDLLIRLEKRPSRVQDKLLIMAATNFVIGEEVRAFRFLREAYEQKTGGLVRLKVEPMLDPLRSTPQFQELLRKMNFPE